MWSAVQFLPVIWMLHVDTRSRSPHNILHSSRYASVISACFTLVHAVSAQVPALTTPGTVCPGDNVTFICTVSSTNLRWEYRGMTRDISAVLDFGKEIDPLGPFHVEVVNITEDGGGGVTSLTSSTTTIATLAINGDMITCFNTALGSLSRTDVEVDVRSTPLHPRPIIDIIDLSSECVLIVLPEENDECFDDYTVQTTTESSITVANTSVANVTICGLNLCNDTLGFRGRSNGDDLNSVESPTSTERFPSPGLVRVLDSVTYTPTDIMAEVSWTNEESFISGLLDIGVNMTTDTAADVSCTASFSDNRFRCRPSYSNFLQQTVTFTVIFQLASCMPLSNSTTFSFPMIIARSTENVTDIRATVILTYVSGINVASGFRLVGTIFQDVSVVENVNRIFRLSDTTYEINNLIRNTSYTYDIRIESGTDFSIVVIGQASGSFTTNLNPPPPESLSLGAAVGITFALTFLVAFTVGLIVAFVIAYCYIQRKILKGQYSPSDTQQPTLIQASAHVRQGDIELKENISYGPVPSQPPTPQQRAPRQKGRYSPSDSQQPTLIQASSHVQEGGIELKENISYGPVPSQPPAPQQHAPMYEEVVQAGNIEVKANVAYGPVSH